MNIPKTLAAGSASSNRKCMVLIGMLAMTLFIINSTAAQTKYVDISATGVNDGSSWANAYTRLSAALNAARADTSIHEIRVAEGVYNPASKSADSVFGIFRGGLKIMGGYPSGGGARDMLQHPTVMDGSLTEGGNSRHVLVISGLASGSDSVIVDGFIIQNGVANAIGLFSYGGTSISRTVGGGVCIVNCGNGGKTVISNC